MTPSTPFQRLAHHIVEYEIVPQVGQQVVLDSGRDGLPLTEALCGEMVRKGALVSCIFRHQHEERLAVAQAALALPAMAVGVPAPLPLLYVTLWMGEIPRSLEAPPWLTGARMDWMLVGVPEIGLLSELA